jgi:predicted acyl esterase
MSARVLVVSGLLIFQCCAVLAQQRAAAPTGPAPTPEQQAELAAAPKPTEMFMKTRDGVKLAANVYMPAGAGPFPVVLSRTPYLKDTQREPLLGKRYTDAGYVFVDQDVRGKGHSEGVYRAFQNDVEDGYDTVEWVAKQAWCTGKIGITGASALGMTSEYAAMAAPPHLTAAFIRVAPYERLLNTYPGGVLKDADTIGWLKRQGAGDDELDQVRTDVTDNSLWQHTSAATNGKYIRIPVWYNGGWYDIFDEGNRWFTYLQNHGADGARGNQKLTMSAAGHGGLTGDIEYPQLKDLYGPNDEMRWWDYWLKGIDTGIMNEPPVTYFMMGSGRKGHPSELTRVVHAANWPPASRATRYYLAPKFTLSTKAPTIAKAELSYKDDPSKPVESVGGANLLNKAGPMDQRQIPQRSDYLRFETPALTDNVVIAGTVHMELYAATDGLDTDFMVKLVDVYPDGYEAIVLDAPIRTRFRHGREPGDVAMMTPNVPEKLDIDLWETAITFEKGHKIAVHIASTGSPKYEVNPNTGEASGKQTMKPRIATNTVYFDEAHPSAMVLPIIYPGMGE